MLSFGVRDAAGNETRTDATAITVDNSPAVVPADADAGVATGPTGPIAVLKAWFAGKSRAVQRTVRYGERAVVEGTLTDAGGRAVANAASLRCPSGRSGWSALGRPALRTDAKGRFSYRLAAGPSRVVEFSSGAASRAGHGSRARGRDAQDVDQAGAERVGA